MITDILRPEFSYFINLDHQKALGTHKIIANEEERENISKRLNLINIESFEIIFRLDSDLTYPKGYVLKADLKAYITQRCISSLEKVYENVDVEFQVRFFPRKMEKNFTEDQLDEEDIEFFDEPEIDVGEIFTQYLSIHMNPYPRLEENPSFSDEKKQDNNMTNPFKVLQVLKGKEK